MSFSKITGFYKVWNASAELITVLRADTVDMAIEVAKFFFTDYYDLTYVYSDANIQTKAIIDKFWIAGVKNGVLIDKKIIEYKTRSEIIDELLIDI